MPCPSQLITTFPTEDDAARAVAVLESRALPYELIEPGPALRQVAVPAVVLGREARAAIGDWKSRGVASSGWVDFKPSDHSLPSGLPTEYQQDAFGQAQITTLAPCVAEEGKIRIVAEVTGDLKPCFAYLNTLELKASLTPDGETLSFMDGDRVVVLYPDRIAAAKPDELVDAWLMLERIRRLVNDTWMRRHELEPCYEVRRKPPALEILKLLPGTNCGLCGELTCMALALQIASGAADPSLCSPLEQPEHATSRLALTQVLM